MIISKEFKDMTFDELVEYHTRRVFDGFIRQGGKGMHDALYTAMYNAIDWNKKRQVTEIQTEKQP